MPDRDVAVPSVPPHVVGDARGDAREASARQVEERARPKDVDPCDDGGVEVGVERIAEGGDEEPLLRRALLVDVPVDLRVPDLVEELGDDLRLSLRQHEPVAVVVVAGVVLVELQEPRALVRRTDVLAIPARDVVEPIGVERRGEQDDHILTHPLPELVLRGREEVGELHRELRGGALGRVHRARDEEHDLALADGLFEPLLARAARVGEEPRVLTDRVEVLEVPRARDDGEQEVAALRALTDLHGLDARALTAELVEVARDLRPIHELEVTTDGAAEVLFRCRHVPGVRDGVRAREAAEVEE